MSSRRLLVEGSESVLTDREKEVVRFLLYDQFEYDAHLRPCEVTNDELAALLEKVAR